LLSLTRRMAERNIVLDARLDEWFFGPPHLHGTRINYAQESIERTRQGLEILAEEVRRE
jgi:DNA-binding transcriptional MocR family regulator